MQNRQHYFNSERPGMRGERKPMASDSQCDVAAKSFGLVQGDPGSNP